MAFSKKEVAMGYVGLTGMMLFTLAANRFFKVSWSAAIAENIILAPAALFAISLGYLAFLLGRESADWGGRDSQILTEDTPSVPPLPPLAEPLFDQAGARGTSMSLAIKVQERYWHPERFDPSQPDTAPKQKEIVEWIKEQRPGISDVLARSIERVACPIDRG